MADYKNTCRIYKDLKKKWNMIWYVDGKNPLANFRSCKGSCREQLIRKAKKLKFDAFYDGYTGKLTSL